jgi:hypothetical protein
VIRKILATADNTRLAKSRKAHGLGLVELWVLKGCQSNQPISQRRSYESRPISGRCSMVSVRRKEPIFRNSTAGSGSEKKIHTWAPFPERERSSAAATSWDLQVSRNADTSSIHVVLSKSTARNQDVSSGKRG